jgi:hypothetical protein
MCAGRVISLWNFPSNPSPAYETNGEISNNPPVFAVSKVAPTVIAHFLWRSLTMARAVSGESVELPGAFLTEKNHNTNPDKLIMTIILNKNNKVEQLLSRNGSEW